MANKKVILDKKNILPRYPREYFAAPVYFALKTAEITSISLEDSMTAYTGLYTEVTGLDWRSDKTSPIWKKILAKIGDSKDPEYITDIMYGEFLQLPHSKYNPEFVPEGLIKFGPLALDYTPYNKERLSIRIHYLVQRGEASYLSSEKSDELRQYFKDFLQHAKDHHSDAVYFTSSTWLNNIPNFVKLFPPNFNKKTKNIGGSSYLGLWGQFVKSDGTGNTKRLAEFTTNLAEAKNIKEVIRAIPLPVLEAVEPIDDFYQMYKIS